MTTCRDIITHAMQDSGLLALGENPTGAEASAGMIRLQAVVSSAIGMAIGEQLADRTVNADADIGSNTRCVASGLSAALTLTLPANPDNGARLQLIDAESGLASYTVTLDPNGRKIEGSNASLSASTAGFNRTWLYQASTADWARVTDLTLNDDFPFPAEFDDFFVLELALRLNPRFGVAMTADQVMSLKQARRRLKAAYRQTVVTRADEAVLRMSTQTGAVGLEGL